MPHVSAPAVEQPSTTGPSTPSRVVVLIAAHDEEAGIEATLRAALDQTSPAAAVVVMADNCTDATVERASALPGVTVVETTDNTHGKSGALNEGWARFRDQADCFACLDADTVIPPGSLAAWVAQMDDEPGTAGVSARFTMQPAAGDSRWANLLARLQKAEFARWTDTALNRGGETTVLAGTACMVRAAALDELAAERAAEGVVDGPWSYASDVEDFELTYRLHRLGHRCRASFTVRAYIDPMVSVRALWAQRVKWQGGTVEDLLRIGVNRLTLRDWGQQLLGLVSAAVRVGWLATTALYAVLGILTVHWIWFAVPLLFIATDVKHSLRVPHRDRRDVVLAALLLPQEASAWLRAGWFLRAWGECLAGVVTGRRKDRWALQYRAEVHA